MSSVSPLLVRVLGLGRAPRRGFSIIEVLIAIFVIGIIATVAFVATGNISSVATGEKLRTDVATLNSALDTYIANGGSVAGLTTAEEVLAKLKTSRDRDDARRHTGGPSGSMVDPRVVAVPVPSADRRLRAVYDPSTRRFDVVSVGAGVRFALDPTLNEINIPNEVRAQGAVVYSKNSSWIWDYNASLRNPGLNPGPSNFKTAKAPADSLPPSAVTPGPPSPPPAPPTPPAPADPRTILSAPVFTPPGGNYPKDTYPKSVAISNLPAPAIGKVVYQLGSTSAWQDYTGGTLSVNVGTELRAKAVAIDTVNYRDSRVTYGRYSIPSPPQLPTPFFNLPGGSYPRQNFPLSLTLNNVPDPAIAVPYFRVNGGGWQTYSGPLLAPKNATMEAKYEPVDSDTYRTSNVRKEYYYPVATDLSGSVTGTFQSPIGGPNLMYSFKDGASFFSNGNPQMDLGGQMIDAGEPNTLRFDAQDFGGIGPNQPFKIGDLFYHNGTTFSDSHATGVELLVKLALADPAKSIEFALKFELVNTENSGDAKASADYVRLTNLNQNINLNIDNVNYSLRLEFGGTDSFGFSTSNEFHVYEGATGRGTINGTFYANP